MLATAGLGVGRDGVPLAAMVRLEFGISLVAGVPPTQATVMAAKKVSTPAMAVHLIATS